MCSELAWSCSLKLKKERSEDGREIQDSEKDVMSLTPHDWLVDVAPEHATSPNAQTSHVLPTISYR